jgi:hypothetical protein
MRGCACAIGRWVVEFKALHQPDEEKPWDDLLQGLMDGLFRERIGLDRFEIEFDRDAIGLVEPITGALVALTNRVTASGLHFRKVEVALDVQPAKRRSSFPSVRSLFDPYLPSVGRVRMADGKDELDLRFGDQARQAGPASRNGHQTRSV